MSAAIVPAICADLIRPALTWFTSGATAHGPLAPLMAAARDPAGFAALTAACDDDPTVSPAVARLAAYRAAVICAAKGGSLPDITAGDALELLEAETSTMPGAASEPPCSTRSCTNSGSSRRRRRPPCASCGSAASAASGR